MNPRWRYFLPGYLMNLPMTAFGILLCIFAYNARHWRWSRGCIECIGGDRIIGKPGAQTWGFLIVYKDEYQRSRVDLRVHERVHVVQGMIGGPIYALTYGLSFLWFWVASGFGPWKAAYHKIPYEIQAYRIGDLAKGWGV